MRSVAAAIVAAALLTACGGSGGGKTQTSDLFLDKVEATCRVAAKKIDAIDPASASAIGDLAKALNTAHADLVKLDIPQPLSRDFGKLTTSLDDQVSALAMLASAVNAGDQSSVDDATSEVNSQRLAADKVAGDLLALSCKGLTPENGFAPASTTDTVALTDPPVTDPPVTDPPVTDPPVTETVTTDSATTETSLAIDLSLGTPAPDGYRWIEGDKVDVSGLYEKPTVGPLVTFYGGGRLENIDDSSTASIYLVQISEEWKTATRAEYEFWEGVEGKDVIETTTPSGIPVKQKLRAFKDTDCVVFTGGTSGITVCTFTGVDGLPILDAFVAANGSG
jgi:hypothetical protein